VGRVRLLGKADQVVQGNRISMADQVALVFREDLEVPVGRVRLPRKADQVVQANSISMADQVALVFREDLEGRAGRVVQGNRMGMADLVDQEVLAGQASIKQGSLVVLGKVGRGASRRTARRTANSNRKVIRPARSLVSPLLRPQRVPGSWFEKWMGFYAEDGGDTLGETKFKFEGRFPLGDKAGTEAAIFAFKAKNLRVYGSLRNGVFVATEIDSTKKQARADQNKLKAAAKKMQPYW
jgi:hypothetical protein